MIQTNRTLLIEEIAPDKNNLISIIQYSEQKKSLSDEEIHRIHESLEVSSFEEVIEKFRPQIYMSLDTDRLFAEFYNKVPLGMESTFEIIPLCKDNTFLDETVKLMENKKKRKYVLSTFQDFSNCLLPSLSPENFYQMRKLLMKAVMANDEPQAERILSEMTECYDDGLFLIKTYLTESYKYIQEAVNDNENMCFVIDDDEDVQVHALEISEHFEYSWYYSDVEEEKYFIFLNKALENKVIKNKNLFTLLMGLSCRAKKNNMELLEKYYREYLNFYSDLVRNFWMKSKPLMETLIGIKNFFDSYTPDDGKMRPRMVIANCTPELLANHKYKEIFQIYLESVNEKNYLDNTIWYAIMPRLPFKGSIREYSRKRFESDSCQKIYKTNELEYAEVILQLLGKYHIQTFLSTIAGNDTVFYSLQKNGIKEFEDSFLFAGKGEYQEYLIPCYPNFTIIPREYALMVPGKYTRYDDLENKIYVGKDRKIWLDELIVEASYIAAGLMASCQCPDYLSEYYPKNTGPDMPGVAYRLCEDEHNLRTVTQMYREITGYSEELYNDIINRTRGVVFAPYKGHVIALTDRVYSYKSNEPDYIANIQTITYMERIIRYKSQDYKQNLIKEFFQSRAGSIISKWKENSECINSILKKEDYITYKINEEDDTCTFEVRFNDRNIKNKVRMNK